MFSRAGVCLIYRSHLGLQHGWYVFNGIPEDTVPKATCVSANWMTSKLQCSLSSRGVWEATISQTSIFEAPNTSQIFSLRSIGFCWLALGHGLWGSTPLHFAAWDAHVLVVERLLEAKAAMDAKDADGRGLGQGFGVETPLRNRIVAHLCSNICLFLVPSMFSAPLCLQPFWPFYFGSSLERPIAIIAIQNWSHNFRHSSMDPDILIFTSPVVWNVDSSYCDFTELLVILA